MRGGFANKLAAFSEGYTGREHPILRQQRLAELGNIMTDAAPDGVSPEQFQQMRVNQLWKLGTPEAADLALKFMTKDTPVTTGLPEGYMWSNGEAVPIPGITPKKPTPLTTEAKLKADYEAGLIDEDTYKKAIAKEIAPSEKTYKQFQLQAASFADRMNKAEGLLQPFEEVDPATKQPKINLINNAASVASKVPFAGKYLENIALSEDQQLYRNAASEWIRAKLRKESGASIPDPEMDQEYRTYFPVPGDSSKTIRQKAELRKNNTASMIKQASGAYEDQYGGETPTVGETFSSLPKDELPLDVQRNMGNIRVQNGWSIKPRGGN